MIDQKSLDFLYELNRNNHREWFQEHRDWYETSRQDFEDFVRQVRLELAKVDEIEKTKVYRIYRDLRFTKDKTPYKTHFAAHFTRKGVYRRGGFYMQISYDEVLIAGGFWGPSREDIQYIREGILEKPEPLRDALADRKSVV